MGADTPLRYVDFCTHLPMRVLPILNQEGGISVSRPSQLSIIVRKCERFPDSLTPCLSIITCAREREIYRCDKLAVRVSAEPNALVFVYSALRPRVTPWPPCCGIPSLARVDRFRPFCALCARGGPAFPVESARACARREMT